jgi:putative chitinase
MINRTFFFDQVRDSLFGGKLKQSQVDGITAVLEEWEASHWDQDDRWLAYMLATAYHETDKTMQPIEEYGRGKGKTYGKPDPETGQIYYGRGLVQLTWNYNYEWATKTFGVDFLNNPNFALDMKYAVKILIVGSIDGVFTGKKLGDYFNEKRDDPVNARRVINGTDKANLVADHYKKFYAAISYTK